MQIGIDLGATKIEYVLLDKDNKEINWHKHCIIIRETEPKRIADSLFLSINAMDDNELINMQISNRKLWIDKLSFGGFYYSFTKKF